MIYGDKMDQGLPGDGSRGWKGTGGDSKGSWKILGSARHVHDLDYNGFTGVHMLKFTFCTLNRRSFLYVNYNSLLELLIG